METEDAARLSGKGFGMQENIAFNGSGELDNGFVVSLGHVVHSDAAGSSTSVITVDMGDMGVLKYQQGTGNIGFAKIDDVMPTAVEEVSDGLGINSTTSATHVLKVEHNTKLIWVVMVLITHIQWMA